MQRVWMFSAAVAALLVAVYMFRHSSGEFPFAARMGKDSQDLISTGPMSRIDPPRLLPEFRFMDDQGRELSLEDFRGKLLLLNIWATWCPPCREEMPSLDRLQSQLGGPEFQVLALSTDRNGVAAVQAFYREAGIRSLELYLDTTGKVETELKIPGLPTTMLIDRSGAAIGVRVGPAQWDADEMVALIQNELGSATE